MDKEPDKITDKIFEQVLAVRDTGRTNMFSINEVMRVAYELELCELVEFLSEKKNHKEYVDLILYGKR